MLTTLFSAIFTSTFTATDYLLCSLAALILGALLALVYSSLNKAQPSFLLTLVMMPVVVQTVIMMVNGNVGTGIAVAGAFGFVRFRSMQYKAEDIMLIFVAVAIGLATSIGYLGFAALFTIISLLVLFVFHQLFKNSSEHRQLRITLPEGVDYEKELDDVLKHYTSYSELQSVKTTNMGSLLKLTYDVVLNNPKESQNFINELRVRNSNLEISLGIMPEVTNV